MAYFLKQTPLKGRTYLSIVESFYDGNKKGTAHKVYKSLSSIETLKKKGIEDPVVLNVKLFKDSLVKIIGDVFECYDSIINLFGGQCQII